MIEGENQSYTPQEEVGNQKGREGLWDQEEHQKYIIFVDFYKKQFNSKFIRKHCKMFKVMSEYIVSRDPVQCRSHHTKQIKSFKKINRVIGRFKKSVGKEKYQQMFEKQTADYHIFKTKIIPTENEKQNIAKITIQIQVQIDVQQTLRSKLEKNKNQGEGRNSSGYQNMNNYSPFYPHFNYRYF